MKVTPNAAYAQFLAALSSDGHAVRIKDVRTRPLEVGGRSELRLFVGEGERAHPRLVATMPPARDPRPARTKFSPRAIPTDAAALRKALSTACSNAASWLDADDLPAGSRSADGARYRRNSVAAQRRLRFFASARDSLSKWIAKGDFPRRHRAAALRVIRELEDDASSGVTRFDDRDTGTYHAYGRDELFVHYLERIEASLPAEGSTAMAVLGADAQQSVRRQREQVRAHLDALMRSKYAFTDRVVETDVERTVGGILIDRRTRMPVSIVPEADPFVPQYELLRIDPASDHPNAGAWVYRDDRGRLRLPGGELVRVVDRDLRSARCPPSAWTFARAPGDTRLRPGIAFDWDEDGVVQRAPLEWLRWAGHCDVKAQMEGIGLVLRGAPTLHEFRSDTAKTQRYDRRLLLEMLASMLELGSDYRSLDGTDAGERGESALGGARNDEVSDRLWFSGSDGGRGTAWPDPKSAGTLRVHSLVLADGQRADLERVFLRWLPDEGAIDFSANPRFVRTIDEDMSLVDISSARLTASIEYDDFDRGSGGLVRKTGTAKLDLRPPASRGAPAQVMLGTVVEDAELRRLWRVFYDPKGPALLWRAEELVRERGAWRVRARKHDDDRVVLSKTRRCGLAREQRRDDPTLFRALLEQALGQARWICADTDAQAQVWNGLVTRLDVRKVAENEAARVQHWRVEMTARFGEAALEYLVRRDPAGEPIEYCPLPGRRGEQSPDFIWSELPDIASKALVNRRWMVNTTMYERGIVTVEPDRSVEGGFYVRDDHIKHVFEMIYCVLSGRRWTIVHDGKRYGYASEAEWKAAVRRLQVRRRALTFEDST